MSALKLSKRHNVSAFCDYENTRYALYGVRIGPTYVEATDGRCLIRAKLDEPSNGQCNAILDGNAFATIKGDCTINSEMTAEDAKDGDGSFVNADGVRVRFSLESTEKKTKVTVKREVPALEGRFPRTDEVFPKGEPIVTVEFDARLLKRFCDYAIANALKAGTSSLKLSIHESGKATAIDVFDGEQTIANGLLMPVDRNA